MGSHKSGHRWLLPLVLILYPFFCIALLPDARNSNVATAVSNPITVSASTSAFPSGENALDLSVNPALSTADALHRNNVSVDFNLTSDLLLDYSSRSRASMTSQMLESLCTQPALQREVVQRCHVFGYGSLANWTQVTQGLPCLPNLKDIHWQNISPVPRMKNFFEHDLPGAWLHVDIQARRDRYDRDFDVRESNFSSLAGLPNLRTLKTHIGYGAEPEHERIGVVHQLLAGCSNVRNLDLTFSHGGCLVSSGQPRAFNFKNAPYSNTTLPPLQRLKLHWYSYGDATDGGGRWTWYLPHPERLLWPFSRVSSEKLDQFVPPPMLHSLQEGKEWLYGDTAPSWLLKAYEKLTGDRAAPIQERCDYPCCKPPNPETINLDAWMDRMSFENIEALDIDKLDVTVAARLLPALDVVTDLTVHWAEPCARDALLRYLHSHRQPLSALHIPYVSLPNNNLSVLLDALALSRSSLITLTLPSNVDLNHSDLSRLASTFPNLTSLTLHHPRILPLLSPAASTTAENTTTTTTPLPFPALHTLTLHIPSPGSLYETTHDPLFNKSALESQLRHSLPPTLRRLEVLLGTWSRRHESSLGGPPDDVLGRYVCERGRARTQRGEGEGVTSASVSHSASSSGGPGDDAYAYTYAEDKYVFHCSGGLTSPSYYGGGEPRVREGAQAGAVMSGDVGEGGDADKDAEGRWVDEDGWVRWEDEWEDEWTERDVLRWELEDYWGMARMRRRQRREKEKRERQREQRREPMSIE